MTQTTKMTARTASTSGMRNKALQAVLLLATLLVEPAMSDTNDFYPKPTGTSTTTTTATTTTTIASKPPTTWSPTQAPAQIDIVSTVDSTADSTCPIQCMHDTKCTRGNQTVEGHALDHQGEAMEFHQDLNVDGWHCDCPPGMTGLRCDRPFMSCEIDDDPESGVPICYHGGQCLSGLFDNYGNNQMFCDCSMATHIDKDTNAVTKYAGKYCQDAIDTSLASCHADDDSVCKNGGLCKIPENHEDPCDCAEGFSGKYCEFAGHTVPTCTKQCQNGGKCRLGNRGTETIDGLQYCECPATHFGDTCEHESAPCGDDYCRHGSTCIEFALTDGTMEHMCDCTAAYTDDVYFAGQYCQYPSNVFCTDGDDWNGRQFCTNGGLCPRNKLDGCICPQGFSGPRCDHKAKEQEQSYASCSIDCMNGGECRKGMKNMTSVNDQFSKDLEGINPDGEDHQHEGMEHCICPAGFFGLKCEYSAEKCENSDLVCYHGSKCVQKGDETMCDCRTSHSNAAGKSCEFLASETCKGSSLAGTKSVLNFGNEKDPQYHGFCTNGGACMQDDRGVMRCRCPTGYEGPHCEYKETEPANAPWIPSNSGAGDGTKEGMLSPTTLSLIAFIALVVAATFLYTKRGFTFGGCSRGDEEGDASADDGDDDGALDRANHGAKADTEQDEYCTQQEDYYNDHRYEDDDDAHADEEEQGGYLDFDESVNDDVEYCDEDGDPSDAFEDDDHYADEDPGHDRMEIDGQALSQIL